MFGVQEEIAETDVYLTNKHKMRMASFSSSFSASRLIDEQKVGIRITASWGLEV